MSGTSLGSLYDYAHALALECENLTVDYECYSKNEITEEEEKYLV